MEKKNKDTLLQINSYNYIYAIEKIKTLLLR